MYKVRYPHVYHSLPFVPRKVEQFKGSDLVYNKYGNIMSDISRLMKVGDASLQSFQPSPVEDKSLGRTDTEKCSFVRSRYCDLPKERIEYEDAIMEQYANTLQSEQRADVDTSASEEQPNVSSEGA